jgi:hypothetical protein
MTAQGPTQTTANTATTGTPADFHITDIPFGGTVVTSIMSAMAAVLWVRRKLSKDNVELAKDRVEASVLQTISAERDRAVLAAEKAWQTRAEDAKLIGQLNGEVKHLSHMNCDLIKEVENLRNDFQQLREVILCLLPRVINMDISDTPYTPEQLMLLLRQPRTTP